MGKNQVAETIKNDVIYTNNRIRKESKLYITCGVYKCVLCIQF